MRTQSMSINAGTAVVRKPPFKRRKLASDVSHNNSHDITSSSEKSHSPAGKLVCTSCQRAINARPESVIVCARCTSLTCPTCSRTCTAPPPSIPPTPHLTYSPTPNPTPPLPSHSTSSPRRTALGLTSLNNASFNSVGGPGGGKRRKFRDEDDDGIAGVGKEVDSRLGLEGDSGQVGLIPRGCGKTICRGCCEESWQSGTTTCLDCYERV